MKILIIICLASITSYQCVEACGGCSTCALQEEACNPTLVRTYTTYQTSGWWLGARRNSKTSYQYYKGTPYCCTGYTLSGLTCTATVMQCGGCDGTGVASETACVRSVLVKTSASAVTSYTCGGWWLIRHKCYSRRTYYYQKTTDISICCEGYSLVGTECQKDSSPQACGVSQFPNPGLRLAQIVGGHDSRPNEFPWQVRLSLSGSGLCGATLLGPSWALTAAHCVDAYRSNPYGVAVIAGDHRFSNYDSTEQIRYADIVHVHDGYNDKTFANDIALLQLNSPVTLTGAVQPACLPSSCDVDYDGKNVIISGWGRSSAGPKSTPIVRFNQLQFTWMVIKPTSYCESFFGPMGTFLCTSDNQGDRRSSPCFGDSGGPMVLEGNDGRFIVTGVASFVADRGCAMGLPSGYTDVRPYLRWIKQHMA